MTIPTPNCDKKIIRVAMSSGLLSPGGVRATGLQIRIGGPDCCVVSNTIDIAIPPCVTPPPVTSTLCIEPNLDLYGYTAIVSYDPINCAAGHVCDRALFDLYLSGNYIGQANLNNGTDGGYRSSTFIISQNISSNNLTVNLICASPNGSCHQGIGRIEIKNTSGETIFAQCLPNDQLINIGNCCISGLYKSGHDKELGERDNNWKIAALPVGISPPESQTIPYSGYIYDPNNQSAGFPLEWNNFSSLIPNAKWIGPSGLIDSIYPAPTDYNIIYSTDLIAPLSGIYNINLVAYPDNYASGFLNGYIDYSDSMKPTIVSGIPLAFDNSIDGKINDHINLSSGNHTLYMVVNDTGAAIGLLVDVSGCINDNDTPTPTQTPPTPTQTPPPPTPTASPSTLKTMFVAWENI